MMIVQIIVTALAIGAAVVAVREGVLMLKETLGRPEKGKSV